MMPIENPTIKQAIWHTIKVGQIGITAKHIPPMNVNMNDTIWTLHRLKRIPAEIDIIYNS